MTRQASNQPKGPQLEEDVNYTATLKAVAVQPSTNAQYPDDQLKIVWTVKDQPKDADELIDYLGLKLGARKDGTIAKLRQLLNALAGRERETELWLDNETLEWGYDMQPGTAPYAKLQAGNGLPAVQFRGELRTNAKGKFYKITSYRAVKSK